MMPAKAFARTHAKIGRKMQHIQISQIYVTTRVNSMGVLRLLTLCTALRCWELTWKGRSSFRAFRDRSLVDRRTIHCTFDLDGVAVMKGLANQ